MRRFELVDGKSNKFWEIDLDGDSFEVRWGRLGTAGQTQTKSFSTNAAAQAACDKLVAEKQKKGYAEVASEGANGSGSAKKAPSTASAATKPKAAKQTAAAKDSSGTATTSTAQAAGATSAHKGTAKSAKASSDATSKAEAADASAAAKATGGATTSAASTNAPPPPPPMTVGEVFWDDDAKRRAFAVRGLGQPAPTIDLAKSWAKLAKHGAKVKLASEGATHPAPPDAIVAARDRLASNKPPADPADVDVEAALLALADWTGNYSRPGLESDVVDVWVATGGVAHALRCTVHGASWCAGTHAKGGAFVSTQRYQGSRTGLDSGALGPWERARAHVTALDDDAYAQALALARELHGGASDEAKLGLAFVFPSERAWANAEVQKPGSGYHRPAILLASLEDPGVAHQLAGDAQGTYRFRVSGGYSTTGFQSVLFTALALHGPGAVPIFEALLEEVAGADDARDLADALARIGTRDALAALAKRADQREFLPAIGDALTRFPELGLEALAPLATGRGKTAEPISGFVKGLLRREGPRLAPVVASLPEAARKLCESLLAASAPREEASADELPEVLRAPRWVGKKKAGPPTLKNLPEVALAPALRWAAGERESWQTSAAPMKISEIAPSLAARTGAKLDAPVREAFERYLEGDDALHAEGAAAVQRLRQASWGQQTTLYAEFFARVPIAVVERALAICPIDQWYTNETWMKAFAAAHERDALPVLLQWADVKGGEALALLRPFGDARIAMIAATALPKKALKADAEAWLVAHPGHAAAGLLPVAFGKPTKARDAAMSALRFLDAQGHRSAIERAAEALGAEARRGLDAILEFDELDLLPRKMPTMPSFWSAEALPRPVLKNGKALPLDAMEHLGTMLALSKEVAEPYAGVALVKEACTPESLAELSWDLFQAWCLAGWPSKEGWAFAQVAWLGDDACVRKLVPMIRAWPGESAHARAVTGLDVLAGIGSDVALMHLNGIAEKLKFKGLQERAREKIAAIAEARGLSAVELADRLVPDLGLDEDGSRTLDFGPRTFRVGFDESLKPFVRDAEGKQIGELPKPKKTDDAALAKAATEIWKALKKDARAIASMQVARLELAMVDRRRWDVATFRTFMVEHPLVCHLVRRLVWGVYEGAEGGSGGDLRAAFRVAEDGSFADRDDERFELADDATLGVAHALDLDEATAAAFGQIFADYAVLQPFPQLGRETYALTKDEAGKKELKRFDGAKVPTGRVLGLESRGWRRGEPQDGGGIWWMERKLPGVPLTAVLDLEPGIIVGEVSMFPEQTLHAVYVSATGYEWRRERVKMLGDLPPIVMSELLRDLEALRG